MRISGIAREKLKTENKSSLTWTKHWKKGIGNWNKE